MKSVLQFLTYQSQTVLWLLFLLENGAITLFVLIGGSILQQKFKSSTTTPYKYTTREILLCFITNILNTIVTYAGFWLWRHGIIEFITMPSLMILPDFIVMFFAMDLLMYIFHFIIHKTFLYKSIHQLHHQAIHPKPIDLFVLHPIETLCFGLLWLVVLLSHAFNIYAVILYLTINVVFGLIGHLGLEPLPERMRHSFLFRYIGTSTFHHDHHQDIQHNFGFYTSLWDRLFKTLRRN